MRRFDGCGREAGDKCWGKTELLGFRSERFLAELPFVFRNFSLFCFSKFISFAIPCLDVFTVSFASMEHMADILTLKKLSGAWDSASLRNIVYPSLGPREKHKAR